MLAGTELAGHVAGSGGGWVVLGLGGCVRVTILCNQLVTHLHEGKATLVCSRAVLVDVLEVFQREPTAICLRGSSLPERFTMYFPDFEVEGVILAEFGLLHPVQTIILVSYPCSIGAELVYKPFLVVGVF